MKKNIIIVEKSEDGFTAYTNELPGVISFGETLKELTFQFKNGLKEHLDFMKEDGDPIPESFQGKYELFFDIDVQQFLEYLTNRVNVSYICKVTGINRSLIGQYKSGAKKPSQERKEEILQSFKTIGEELVSVC